MKKNLIKSTLVVTLICIIFSNIKCNGVNDNSLILKEYYSFKKLDEKTSIEPDSLIFDKSSLAFFRYDNAGNLVKINTEVLGSRFGHYFKFKNESLNLYYFFIDSSHYKIQVVKDSISGRFTEKGSAYTDYIENFAKKPHKKYSLLFSEFPRKKLIVSVSFNGHDFSPVTLHNSNLMPLLAEADIECDDVVHKIFLKTEASQLIIKAKGLEDTKKFFQTITF